ncbi:MAG: ABC transporter permease [Ruminococcus sp.]|jgi:ribose/xylose/arabinose/galactoside ABC-type transport system permease subunit
MNRSVWFTGKLKMVTKQKAVLAVIFICLAMTIISPYFFTAHNLSSLLLQVTTLWIMAFGVTFCIISGECDLSLGANMCITGVIAIKLLPHFQIWVVLIIVLLVGALIGAVNAFISVNQGANSFIVTLGMMLLLKGICLVMTDGAPISGNSKAFAAFGSGRILGIYNITWIAILVFIACLWTMKHTQFGRNCYAVGGDKAVAAYSGIAVKRHLWITFIISAVSAALAGFCLSAELNSGSSTYGENTALLINCGVVVGGTPFNGGYGGMLQSLIGVFLFGLLENVMNLLAITPYTQQLVRGILIVLVIAMDCHARKKKRESV